MKSLDKITNHHETTDQVKKPPSKKINGFSLLATAGQSPNTDTVITKNDSVKPNKTFYLKASGGDNSASNSVIQKENTPFNQKNTPVLDSSLIKENPNIKGALIPKPDTYAELIKTSDELKNVINKSNLDNKTKELFTSDIDDINKIAKKDGVYSKYADVYENIAKLITIKPNQPLNIADGETLAKCLLNDIKNSHDINQGDFKTCTVTALRENMLINHPDILAKIVTDAFLSDGNIDVASNRIKINLKTLIPDDDANDSSYDWKLYSKIKGKRDYLGQVSDNVLMNVIVQNRDPQLRYVESKDFDENTPFENYIQGNNKNKDNSTPPNTCELSILAHELNGNSTKVLMYGSVNNTYGNLITINNPNDLLKAIEANPGLLIFLHSSCLKENDDSLNLSNDGHVMTAVRLNNDHKSVTVSNQWGIISDHDFTLTELYNAIKGIK